MAMNQSEILKSQYLLNKGLGRRSISSDARLVISGYEYLTALIKDFAWPILSTAGEVEIWLPGGQKTWQDQVLETGMQNQITITETSLGHAYDAIHKLNGNPVDCYLYEGSPQAFYRGAKIRGAFFKFDPAERSFESRSSVTQYTGTMFYNFFAEIIAGNIR